MTHSLSATPPLLNHFCGCVKQLCAKHSIHTNCWHFFFFYFCSALSKLNLLSNSICGQLQNQSEIFKNLPKFSNCFLCRNWKEERGEGEGKQVVANQYIQVTPTHQHTHMWLPAVRSAPCQSLTAMHTRFELSLPRLVFILRVCVFLRRLLLISISLTLWLLFQVPTLLPSPTIFPPPTRGINCLAVCSPVSHCLCLTSDLCVQWPMGIVAHYNM